MDEIPLPQEFHSTRELLQEMSNNDLVQATSYRHGIFSDHISQCWIVLQLVPLLDEI
jgi:hypothetical protein